MAHLLVNLYKTPRPSSVNNWATFSVPKTSTNMKPEFGIFKNSTWNRVAYTSFSPLTRAFAERAKTRVIKRYPIQKVSPTVAPTPKAIDISEFKFLEEAKTSTEAEKLIARMQIEPSGPLAIALLASRHLDAAWKCYTKLPEREIDTANLIPSFLEAYGWERTARGMHALHKEMRSRNITPSSRFYNQLFKLMSEEEYVNISKAWNYYEEMKRLKVLPTQSTFHWLVAICEKTSSLLELEQLVEEMYDKRVEATLTIANRILSAYLKCGDAESFWDFLKDIPKPNSETYALLINASYILSSSEEQAEKYFTKVERKGELEVAVFNAILQVFQMANKPDKVIEYWNQLTDFAEHNAASPHRQPNVTSYTIMLKLYRQQRAYTEAVELWKHIPNEVKTGENATQLRDLMMATLQTAGLHKKAIDVYTETRPKVRTTYATYDTLAECLRKPGETKEHALIALYNQQRMAKDSIDPPLVAMACNTLASLGDLETVKKVLSANEMSENTRLQIQCSVMSRLAKQANRTDLMMNLFKEIKAGHKYAVPEAYMVLIDVHGHLGEMKTLLHYWHEFLENRDKEVILPDSMAISVVNALGINRRAPEITTVFNELLDLCDYKPSREFCHAFMSHLGRYGQVVIVQDLWDKMVDRDELPGPNMFTYMLMMRTFSKRGQTEKMLEYLTELKKAYPQYEQMLRVNEDDHLFQDESGDFWNVIPKTRLDPLFTLRGLYNMLIEGYSKGGKYDESWMTFNEMKNRGISPDVVTYTMLFDMCGYTAKAAIIPSLLSEMQETYRLPMTDNVYCSIIEAYARCGQLPESVSALEQARKKGIPLTIKLATTFASSVVLAGVLTAECQRLIKAFASLNPENTYVTTITKELPPKHMEQFATLVKDVKSSLQDPNLVTEMQASATQLETMTEQEATEYMKILDTWKDPLQEDTENDVPLNTPGRMKMMATTVLQSLK